MAGRIFAARFTARRRPAQSYRQRQNPFFQPFAKRNQQLSTFYRRLVDTLSTAPAVRRAFPVRAIRHSGNPRDPTLWQSAHSDTSPSPGRGIRQSGNPPSPGRGTRDVVRRLRIRQPIRGVPPRYKSTKKSNRMVTFTQIPDNNTPLGGAVVYAFACDTPQTVDLRVTEAESGTLLGVRRFVEASAAECDIVFAPEDTSQTSRISGRIR